MTDSAIPARGGTLRLTAALLRCGSCRFSAFYFLPFYVGVLDAHGIGRGTFFVALFGAVYWFLNCLGTELLNRLSDRVEDEVNRPERTALCHSVGFPRIKVLAIITWVVIGLIDLIWCWREPNIPLAILLVLGICAGVCYSYWLRLKTKKYLCLVALTFPVGGPFLIGWCAFAALPEGSAGAALVARGYPMLLLLGAFILSLAGIKDITDAAGDEKIGYRGLIVTMLHGRAFRSLLLVLLLPFLTLAILLPCGLLPPRFSSLFAFLPVSLMFAASLLKARENHQRQALRELLYHYWFLCLVSVMMLYLPTAATVFASFGTALFWVATSQFLHWSPGLRLEQIRIFTGLACQPSLATQAPEVIFHRDAH